jgi:hypothetical protein
VWSRRILPLVEGDNVVDRDEDVAVRIDALGISRRHALIRLRAESRRSKTSAARTERTCAADG